jgi:hypothetical protein
MVSPVKAKPPFALKIEEIFGLDLRSLAVFRIGLASVVLIDLAVRAGQIEAHYSDSGVLPRSALIDQFLNPWYWSINLISGQPFVQALLFGAAIAIALCLLVGFRTRLATIALWAAIVSIHNRNPALIFAGDDALRAILFWSMFLPLGACYAIDSALNSSPRPLPKRALSFATVALMVQLGFIYMFSAWFKHQSPMWSSENSAVYYALHFDPYATAFDRLLVGLPWLLAPLTVIVLWLEWLGPLLLLVPVRTSFFRCLAIGLFILLHIGFGLFFEIGIFPLLCISTWLAFLPSQVWDALEQRIYNKKRANLKIYYDAECVFCKKAAYLLRVFLILPGTPLLLAQDEPSIYADLQPQNSWVVVDWQDRRHFQWKAIAYLTSLSPLFGFLAPVLQWQPIKAAGIALYETAASHLRLAGKVTAPLKFRPLEVRSSVFINSTALLLLLLVILWNLRSFANQPLWRNRSTPVAVTLHRIVNSRILQSIDWLSRLTRLDQSWSIFAPNAPRDDGWHVIVGKLKNGTEVDVLRGGGSVGWEKPTIAQRNALYQTMQWRTYFINLNRAIGRKLYPYYGQYLCREWNARHGEDQQLESLEIFFMSERTVPPGQTQNVEKTLHWQQSCLGQP